MNTDMAAPPPGTNRLPVGLALAGGGVSGAAAVGVIKALEEAGFAITQIAGSSSGAMVAALYAYGFSPEKMKRIMPRFTKRHLDYDWKAILAKILLRRPHLDGWIKGTRLRLLVEELTDGQPLSAFRMACGIVATDLRDGQPVVFANKPVPGYRTESELTIGQAVQASCAIPVIFQPVRWQRYILADGGVSLNCPVRVVRALGAKRVIAVDTVTAFANADVGDLRSALSIFAHVINLNLRDQMAYEHQHADLSLHPHVGYVGALDFHKVAQCVEAGYCYTRERIDQIRALFEDVSH
ncbi:patatin-like phospholipase family protein [Effusibacillus pohliae]|uniref:patatin-like phospholipase family protein n=1 Tax=Effusibacillus pohliae TaxID=232270 RepID=UPI000363EB72|nr:patatin-like phospholipase family protein [Effusibacillus pohliae]